MTASSWIIAWLWIALLTYWGVSALRAKQSRRTPAGWRAGGVRVAFIILVLLASRLPVFRQALANPRAPAAPNMLLEMSGVGLCALGLGFAVWARVSIGRDWGMPMTRRQEPALVTTGPYALVRHPIYAGFITAMVGSAVGQNIFWVVPLVLEGGYFLYSARQEERFLRAQFPDQYPRYRDRTKMLIPLLL